LQQNMCKHYHPKAHIQCKFQPNCEKSECGFKHDKTLKPREFGTRAHSKADIPCKHNPCTKGDCEYNHDTPKPREMVTRFHSKGSGKY
jgi:hypothetical protein